MDRKTCPEEYREQVVALARAGRSYSSLAHEFEPSMWTMRKWVERTDDRVRSGRRNGESQWERENM